MDTDTITVSSNDDTYIPRNYQVELMKIAVAKNSILYLPTGAGKTYIAVLVLKQLSSALQKSYCDGGKISVILVNTVALVDQHCKYVQDHTTFKVGTYTGAMNVDYWSKGDWTMELNKYKVLIMTSQILYNLIVNGFIDLQHINLIIFDECHRGVENHPMRSIMKSFPPFSTNYEQPRVIGLTATLLNGNCSVEKVMNEVKELEITYRAQVATVDGLQDVLGYSTNPKEQFRFYSKYEIRPVDSRAVELLHKVQKKCEVTLHTTHTKLIPWEPLNETSPSKQINNLIDDLIYHISELGTLPGYFLIITNMIKMERFRKFCQDSVLFTIFTYVLTVLGQIKQLFELEMSGYTNLEKAYKFSSDKVLKLLDIIADYPQNSNEQLSALIFTKRRTTAKILHHIIEYTSTKWPHIRSNYIVGNCQNPYKITREGLFLAKKNKEVLNDFANQQINLLFSSNVLEEGIDIPQCTLVAKFDKDEEYRGYIQSKGRARHPSSLYYTMVECSETKKYMKKYSCFQKIERTLNMYLIGANNLRTIVTAEEVDGVIREDCFPPYFTNGPNSAQVNMQTAISLLCCYCQSLPSDSYTVYTPDWYIETDEIRNKYRVIIILPTVCSVTDNIMGPFMENKKDAKKAAALQACINLHQCQELDDDLKPKRKDVTQECRILFEHWADKNNPTDGINKNKKLYRKLLPKCLTPCNSDNEFMILHIICTRLHQDAKKSMDSHDLYDMKFNSDLCFGILTSYPLPNICSFPIFDHDDEIVVTLKCNVRTLHIDSGSKLKQIRGFHLKIFADVLDTLQPFLIFGDHSSDNTEHMLLVPIHKHSNEIAYDIIEMNNLFCHSRQLDVEERKNVDVRNETFLHKIVNPWYRGEKQFYMVTRVCEEICPKSCFPNAEFTDYIEYFDRKHNQSILNHHQSLVLVKALSKNVNFYKPQSTKTKRRRCEPFEEHLIPELLIKHELPAPLWLQAQYIPTILSRVVNLVRIQEFRTYVASELSLTIDRNDRNEYLVADKSLLGDHLKVSSVPNENGAAKIKLSPVNNTENALNVTNLCNKDFADKVLEAQYPWRQIDEPKDINRSLDVTVADIEHYETFVAGRLVKSDLNSDELSDHSMHRNVPAISYHLQYSCKNLGLLSDKPYRSVKCPPLCDFYAALTTAKANDIVNMERLEVLGDSFLKLIASIYIWCAYPKYNEGYATSLKGKLVSNRNLYYLACEKKLAGILLAKAFSPKTEWIPPGFVVPSEFLNRIASNELSINSLFYCNTITMDEKISGNISQQTKAKIGSEVYPVTEDEVNSYPTMSGFIYSNYVGDKTIADSVEALLGMFFERCGFSGAVKFVEWMKIIPASEKLMYLINSPPVRPFLKENISMLEIEHHIPQWRECQKMLGYEFKDLGYLLQALTHSSYTPNRLTHSYEKLEFIGDAILDFLITCYIYEHCGCLSPGQVTDLRSALVNNNTFGSLVVRNDFHKFLLIINSRLQTLIDKFVGYLSSKNFTIDHEVLILLEEQDVNIAEYIDVPKVLGDLFESLAGAVYLDSGKNLNVVWHVFYKLMWREMEMFSHNVPINVLRKLYECPNLYPKFGDVVAVSANKTMIPLSFMSDGRKKMVHGFGSNKTMAKRAAAKIALKSLNL